MHRSACGSCGVSTAALTSAAASSTAPAAVTQECSGCGERKNDSAPNDVCVSSTSANHTSHCAQSSFSRPKPWIRWYRLISSTADGGDPARTSSVVTAFSRREKALYIVGRYEMTSAISVRPIVASVNTTTVLPRSSTVANPSVSIDEPLMANAARHESTPSAQKIAV